MIFQISRTSYHCMVVVWACCAQVKDGLVVLKSGKASLERCLAACLDLQAQMEAKAAGDPALTSKVDDIKAAAEGLGKFLAELRAFVSMTDMQGAEAEDLGVKASKCAEYKDKAIAHQDG